MPAVLSDIATLFICWLFLSAGFHKLSPSNSGYYRQLVTNYGLSRSIVSHVAIPLLGTLEFAIALLILIPAFRLVAALAAVALLLGYGILMANALLQGKRDVDCGCGDPAKGLKISPLLLLRNVSLIAIALTAGLLPDTAAQIAGSGLEPTLESGFILASLDLLNVDLLSLNFLSTDLLSINALTIFAASTFFVIIYLCAEQWLANQQNALH